MALLNQLLETCATLTKKVRDLEQDKIPQEIEITKLKQRVRRLEKKRKLKALRLKRSRKVGTAKRVESSANTVMDDQEMHPNRGKIDELDANEDVTLEEVDAKKDAEVQGRLPESQAHVYHLELEHAQKFLKVVTIATTPITVAHVPKASAPRRRRGVIIQGPEEAATASIIDEAFTRELDAKLNANINWNEVIEQARKNMMVYLKNMAGFKMKFFKGMSYTDIRPIFENHFNSNWAFLEKREKEIEEEENKLSKRKGENLKQEAAKKQKLDEEVEELKTHLQIIPNDEDDVYTKATPLALKVPVDDYQIHFEHNKPYYKIIRADGTRQLFLSFISLLRNFDREDLEMLWKIVQERFASSEPKNFSYDFLLNALKTMFEKPDIEDNIWKNQRGIYGLAKVKS
nr:hypothetical protein [Tanacetum cinerariifolium]